MATMKSNLHLHRVCCINWFCLFTDRCECLSWVRHTDFAPFDQVVTEETGANGHCPHARIRQWRIETVLFDRKSHYIVHVLRQIVHNDKQSPIVTHLSCNQCQHRWIGEHSAPWWTGKIGATLQLAQFTRQIIAFFVTNIRMAIWIVETNQILRKRIEQKLDSTVFWKSPIWRGIVQR